MSDAFKLSRAALDDDDEALSPLCRSILDGTHRDVRPKCEDQALLRDEIAALTKRITSLETANKRAKKSTSTVSRKDFEFAIETIGRFVGKELDPILQRIEKLETQSSGVKWAGIWHDGLRCAEGELVTDRGSLWICTSAVERSPRRQRQRISTDR